MLLLSTNLVGRFKPHDSSYLTMHKTLNSSKPVSYTLRIVRSKFQVKFLKVMYLDHVKSVRLFVHILRPLFYIALFTSFCWFPGVTRGMHELR